MAYMESWIERDQLISLGAVWFTRIANFWEITLDTLDIGVDAGPLLTLKAIFSI